MEFKKNTRISSLQRALKVLDFFGENPNGCDIKEVALEMNINISTCYHILNTLMDEGYLIKKKDGQYFLGPKIPWLNNAFMNSINPDISLLDELNNLHKETSETVNLLVVRDKEIIIQSVMEGLYPLKVSTLYEGYSGNYHARAATKSILAFWDEAQIDSYFQNYNFKQFTSKTPLNINQLKETLKPIKEKGYCLEQEEYLQGVCCVASPIFNSKGKVVGSYAITSPKERFLDKKEEMIKVIINIASRASMSIGYMGRSHSKFVK